MTRAALLVLLLALTAGCGGAQEAVVTGPEPDRPQAPRLGGVTLDGDHVWLSEFRGKPTFVVVWSSW